MNPSIRWLSFVILLLALLVTQMAMGRLMGIGPQRIMPDLLLLLAIFLALRSSCTRTILACWVLGLVKDLSSSSVLGSYAISFSLVAFLILSLREWLYAGNPLTILLACLVGSFLTEQIAFGINCLRGHFPLESYQGQSLEMFFSAAFTAALAPFAQVLLLKLSHQLGVSRQVALETG
jgi:rod shape-determining protein MreD